MDTPIKFTKETNMKTLNNAMMVLAATLVTTPALAHYEMLNENFAITVSTVNPNHYLTIERAKDVPVNSLTIRIDDKRCMYAPAMDRAQVVAYKVNGRLISTVQACTGQNDLGAVFVDINDMRFVSKTLMEATGTVKFYDLSGSDVLLEFEAKGFKEAYQAIILNNFDYVGDELEG